MANLPSLDGVASARRYADASWAASTRDSSLLEGLPAIIILALLLLPIAIRFGFDAAQYGVVLILAMGIGAFMPPIGIGFYVAATVAGSRVEEAAAAMLPYLVVLLLAVLLIAFVPATTLALPMMLR